MGNKVCDGIAVTPLVLINTFKNIILNYHPQKS